jgi:N-acetylmuramoyl-L-alanine amidase
MRSVLARAVWILGVVVAWSLPAGAVDVRQIRVWSGPADTRVVLDLSGRTTHALFMLRNPDRIVLDLPAARLSPGATAPPPGAGMVRDVRVARRPAGALRVVLDLKGAAVAKSFLSPPNERYGYRLVLDLATRRAVEAPVRAIHAPPRARDLVIAVDPGHGGEDPGAIGLHGTREKDVVLAIAKDLAARIDAEPGMRAYLTRDGDYFVPLRDRMRKARAHDADLFVSIHADSVRNHSVDGSSVYILSQRGASDEAARWLAERENESDLIGGVPLDDKDQVLASVLLDLSQSAAMTASEEAARRVLRALDQIGEVRKHQVQQARFIVLKSPDVPSMLVETAYISNPREELKLRTPARQLRIADAILKGVRNYFYANPPPGSRIAQLVAERDHRTLVADGSGG